MSFTEAVYTHLHSFLKEIAEQRPTLGNVRIKGEYCHCANGYMLYEFSLSSIDKHSWVREHCEVWNNEQAWGEYLRVDEDGNESFFLGGLNNYLPCGNPIVSLSSKGYPDTGVITNREWVIAGSVKPSEIWSLCYTQQSAFAKAGKPFYLVQLPNCPANLSGKFLEHALKSPFFLIADELTISYAATKEDSTMFMIKLESKEAKCIIMNHLGDITP